MKVAFGVAFVLGLALLQLEFGERFFAWVLH
jgi:hypothetical protein